MTRPVWEEKPTVAGQAGKGTLLTLVTAAVIIPLWTVVVTSLSSRATIDKAGGLVFIPRGFDFSAYQSIFATDRVTRALWVSVMITAGGTLLSITLTTMAAYGLSRPGSLAHRPLLFLFLLTFLFGPGIIPSYLLVTGVGLKDNLLALILPTAVNAFNLVVLRAFFMNLPGELIDSARIDGASEWRILWQIVIPLSKAVIAVVALFYAVGYWNSFFNAILYLSDPSDHPIQLVLRSYILQGQAPPGVSLPGTNVPPPTLAIKMAVVVVTVIPALLVYPFVQKHFTKAVLTGAIKG
ncbi:ABC transporter permease [Rhizocola hellebori]|uniref:ABC transporter permease n=1 Tax=Rhizocola hellebori TaxID=1392758 RepID=A0A8J3QHY9_9ACTN|nr:carbohydrate ABC transporter permease [Rhizocola hellebori]GIH10981.1 ABC transporter permease [Rhizocola hellebori]